MARSQSEIEQMEFVKKKYPVCIMDNLNKVLLGDQIVFDEANPVQCKSKTQTLYLDLYRLLRFRKDTVDEYDIIYFLLY